MSALAVFGKAAALVIEAAQGNKTATEAELQQTGADLADLIQIAQQVAQRASKDRAGIMTVYAGDIAALRLALAKVAP